jgi:hypothetical protein
VGSVGAAMQDTASFHQALQELGKDAPLSDVATRAQEIKLQRQAAQATPAKWNPRLAPDIANWQPPPELGVTSAPDYGAAARADVERQMGGPLKRGTATAEPEAELSPEAQSILGRLRDNAKQIQAQEAEQASVPKPEDDLTDILQRSIEAVKQKRLAAKKARTIQ